MYFKTGGAWKAVTEAYIKVNGAWKAVLEGYIRVAGAWKKFWGAESLKPLNPVEIRATQNNTTYITRIIGKTYHWLGSPVLQGDLEWSTNNGSSWTSINSFSINNPSYGNSREVPGTTSNPGYDISPIGPPVNYLANVVNLYRFKVDAANISTGLTGQSVSTSNPNTSLRTVTIQGPTDIVLTQGVTGETFAIINWNASTGANRYLVELFNGLVYAFYAWTDDTSISLTLLDPGTTYTVRVTPYSGTAPISSTTSPVYKGYPGNPKELEFTTVLKPIAEGGATITGTIKEGQTVNLNAGNWDSGTLTITDYRYAILYYNSSLPNNIPEEDKWGEVTFLNSSNTTVQYLIPSNWIATYGNKIRLLVSASATASPIYPTDYGSTQNDSGGYIVAQATAGEFSWTTPVRSTAILSQPDQYILSFTQGLVSYDWNDVPGANSYYTTISAGGGYGFRAFEKESGSDNIWQVTDGNVSYTTGVQAVNKNKKAKVVWTTSTGAASYRVNYTVNGNTVTQLILAPTTELEVTIGNQSGTFSVNNIKSYTNSAGTTGEVTASPPTVTSVSLIGVPDFSTNLNLSSGGILPSGYSLSPSRTATGNSLGAAPTPTGGASITGSVQESKTVTLSAGSWNNNGSTITGYTYYVQRYLDDPMLPEEDRWSAVSTINSANTSVSYQISSDWINLYGTNIRLFVTATNGNATSLSGNSTNTTVAQLLPGPFNWNIPFVSTEIPPAPSTMSLTFSSIFANLDWSDVTGYDFFYAWITGGSEGFRANEIFSSSTNWTATAGSTYTVGAQTINKNKKVKVTWNPSSDANSYRIGYTVSVGTSPQTVSTVVSGSTTELEITIGNQLATVTINSVRAYLSADGSNNTKSTLGSAPAIDNRTVSLTTNPDFTTNLSLRPSGGVHSGGYALSSAATATGTRPSTPVANGGASISGSVTEGSTVTLNAGNWLNSPTSYRYAIERYVITPGGIEDYWSEVYFDTSSNTSVSYTIPSNWIANYGNSLRLLVTASNAAGTDNSQQNTNSYSVSAALAGLTPTFGTVTRQTNGWASSVTNYSSLYTWNLSVSPQTSQSGGAITVSPTSFSGTGTTKTFSVSGLADGEQATVTVTTNRPGYSQGSATLTSNALNAPLTPAFGTVVSGVGGFSGSVTNYSDLYTWNTPSVASGTLTNGTWTWGAVPQTGSTRTFSVSGLSAGASATATVTTSRSGYRGGSNDVTGTASSVANLVAPGIVSVSSPISSNSTVTVVADSTGTGDVYQIYWQQNTTYSNVTGFDGQQTKASSGNTTITDTSGPSFDGTWYVAVRSVDVLGRVGSGPSTSISSWSTPVAFTVSTSFTYYVGTSTCNVLSGCYTSLPAVSGPFTGSGSFPTDTTEGPSNARIKTVYRTTSAAALADAANAACIDCSGATTTTTTTAAPTTTTSTTAATTTTTAAPSKTLTVNCNGGTGCPSSGTYTGDYVVPATNPTRSGFTFSGYDATCSGSYIGRYTANSTISCGGSLTLNAVWTAVTTTTTTVAQTWRASACCNFSGSYSVTNGTGSDATTALNQARANCTNGGGTLTGTEGVTFGTSFPTISCSAPATTTTTTAAPVVTTTTTTAATTTTSAAACKGTGYPAPGQNCCFYQCPDDGYCVSFGGNCPI